MLCWSKQCIYIEYLILLFYSIQDYIILLYVIYNSSVFYALVYAMTPCIIHMTEEILKEARGSSHAKPRLQYMCVPLMSPDLTLCFAKKCVSVGQRFPRHMRRAHAAWLYQHVARSNKHIQLTLPPMNMHARIKRRRESYEIMGTLE